MALRPLSAHWTAGATQINRVVRGRKLRKASIVAADGEIGGVHDVYFDTNNWTVRHLVVDTRKWLPGRKVLVAPHAIQSWDERSRSLRLTLTREQIRHSPDIDAHLPISRQMTAQLGHYYGGSMAPGALVPPLMTPFGIGPVYPYTGVPAPTAYLKAQAPETEQHHNSHLRSMKEITGYRVETSDGDVGRVRDFAVDLRRGEVTLLVIEVVDNAVSGEVAVGVARVREIRWDDRRVKLSRSAAGLSRGAPR
jgi:sporulation protein YlmC with PRC-barrel domain